MNFVVGSEPPATVCHPDKNFMFNPCSLAPCSCGQSQHFMIDFQSYELVERRSEDVTKQRGWG